MNRVAHIMVLLLVTLLWVQPMNCLAQNGTQRTNPSNPNGLIPVDQAVDDLDRIAVSTRQMQPGLSPYGQQTRLFRATGPVYPWSPYTTYDPGDVYLRIGPGYRAIVDRIDYMIPRGRRDWDMNVAPRRDGRYVEQAATNTVWDLRPIPFIAPNASDPTSAIAGRQADSIQSRNSVNNSTGSTRLINGQVNPGPIDGRVDGRADGRSSNDRR
jgi:hypothetical protein